jgi:hypothetical protein
MPSRSEFIFMAIVAFIITFGMGGLYQAVQKERAIVCQEGC